MNKYEIGAIALVVVGAASLGFGVVYLICSTLVQIAQIAFG